MTPSKADGVTFLFSALCTERVSVEITLKKKKPQEAVITKVTSHSLPNVRHLAFCLRKIKMKIVKGSHNVRSRLSSQRHGLFLAPFTDRKFKFSSIFSVFLICFCSVTIKTF